MPSTQSVHYDKLLTNISVGYTNEDYIATQVLKEVPVDKQSDRYPVYGEEIFIAHDDARAPGTEANEINWTYSDDTYFCEGHALRHRIPDEVKQNSDNVFDLEQEATILTSEGILLNKEISAANILLNANSYDPDLVVPTGGANQPLKWDNANADPIALVSQMKEAVHTKIVLNPNTLILSYPVYNRLRRHPSLLALFKTKEVSLVPIEIMKEFFEVDNIIVGKAVASTRVANGYGAKSYVWGKSAILAYVPKNPGKKVPALGYTYAWNKDGKGSVLVRKWYEDGPRCTFVEAERWYDHKIVSNRAGVLFPDVIG
jgi:hypothetical protein